MKIVVFGLLLFLLLISSGCLIGSIGETKLRGNGDRLVLGGMGNLIIPCNSKIDQLTLIGFIGSVEIPETSTIQINNIGSMVSEEEYSCTSNSG